MEKEYFAQRFKDYRHEFSDVNYQIDHHSEILKVFNDKRKLYNLTGLNP